MNYLHILLATLAMTTGGFAAPAPAIELSEEQKIIADKRWEPSAFATMPAEEVLREYGRYCNDYRGKASPEINAEIAYQVGLNTALRDWLSQYFSETPVLFENWRNRQGNLVLMSYIHSEWSVKMMLEIALDDRPMKSTYYNYDDPKWVEEKHHEAEQFLEEDAQQRFLSRFGMGAYVRGKNSELATNLLYQMKYVGVPNDNELQQRALSIADWLRQPGQRDRLPEILKATWGDRVVLNADIGLGPDNKPLRADGKPQNAARPPKGSSGARATGAINRPQAAETDHAPRAVWIPATLAALVLGAAIFVVGKKKA